jgi:hypothetical protein
VRRIWVLAVSVAFFGTLCNGQFFPKKSLDLRGDDFKAKWYSSQLRAMNEPSLLSMASDPASYSYRFLWLRTFNHPIAVRMSGAGGYSPGVLTEDKSRPLTAAEMAPFLSEVEKLGFWTAPNPVNDQEGTDGSQWIIEGVRGGKYHVVDRWSPKRGVVHDLGLFLAFQLGKLNIPPNEIY